MECGTEILMSKRKKEGSVAILTGKEETLKLDDLQKVMHYFGWEYVRIIGGSWEFSNKSLKGNYCYIKQSFGGTYIARIEFSSIQNSKVTKQDVARAKTWFGLFNAIKAHTKSLIYKRDVLGQYTAG